MSAARPPIVKVVAESCVMVTEELIRFDPLLSVSVRFWALNVEGLMGSVNATFTDETGPLCGLVTCVMEATAGGANVVGR